MKQAAVFAAVVLALGLSACEKKETIVTPGPTVAVPGPQGAKGEPGAPGAPGAPGESKETIVKKETVVVVPQKSN